MSNHGTQVLLIEDNPGDADLIRLRLVEANSDVEVKSVDRLSSGLESLAASQPSLVLLDLNLPDSNGAETFRKILDKAPGVPVVILSGQDDEELANKALHQGAQDYLVKGGFDAKDLARAMRYAIERQSMLLSLEMSRKQQIEFKNQFLSHVSHELRTPLTCIHQFVTILLDGLAGPLASEQSEHLETVLRSANQLRSMIADLLEATRAESGKILVEPRGIVIGEVVRQAISMLRAIAHKKGIGLEIAVDSRTSLVYADPGRVLQVLTNLIENAIKFTPADGSVMVNVTLSERDPDFVCLSITDTGKGISPEAKALIFERLYQDPNTIDDSRKGLGLGLYIARELVQLHGGKIWVESQPGHGSTFTFTLPKFSLAKLLFPIVTENGKIRPSLFLVSVRVLSSSAARPASWKHTLQECQNVLRHCVYLDKDLLLPAMGSVNLPDTFFVVASTDEPGVQIMMKRIREQLPLRLEKRTGVTVEVVATTIPLPAGCAHSATAHPATEALVSQIADSVTAMVPTLSETQMSSDADNKAACISS
jgi:signal transduction histidine kinase